MGGGLMQLVAYGAQDIYLTGQPQITFFKSVYRRHTNFSVESILQTINGSSSPGSRVSVTISRNGDLLKNLWVQYNPNNFITTAGGSIVPASDFGHALFDQLEIEIGGQLIDRQFGKWLTVWRDLCEINPTGAQGELQVAGAEPGVNVDAGGNPSTRYQRMAYTHQGGGVSSLASAPSEAYVPMKFWFCCNPGLAVPLIALQYHEVKFNITYQTLAKLVDTDSATGAFATPGYSTINVYADYVYLDTTERRQFAQNAHEYLINQLQIQNDNVNGGTIRLNFNHPVKELIWTGAPVAPTASSSSVEDVQGGATPTAIVAGAASLASTTVKSKIVLNGTDRFTERNLKYFTRNQVWDCHTGFGATGVPDSIALYSFALRPEEHQPSGTCNFSRIDTAQLVFTNISGVTFNPLDIYAVNYNVLRIMSGMGGLAYSN